MTSKKTTNYILIAAITLLIVVLTLMLYPRTNKKPAVETPPSNIESTQGRTTPTTGYYPENGIYNSTPIKSEKNDIQPFSLKLPQGWRVTQESYDETSFYVSFERERLHLSIAYPSEISRFIFPENYNTGEFGYVHAEHHKYIDTDFGAFRVAKRDSDFNLCVNTGQGDQFTNSPWGSHTSIGSIAYSVPDDDDPESTNEIEQIIQTITLLKE